MIRIEPKIKDAEVRIEPEKEFDKLKEKQDADTGTKSERKTPEGGPGGSKPGVLGEAKKVQSRAKKVQGSKTGSKGRTKKATK